MESLLCKTDKDLMSILSLDKPFQARIIRDNLIKGVTSFDEMTSLPKALRERLSKERGSALTGRIIRKEEADSTVKIAVSFPDGAIIECVRLSDGTGRYTACLSSQVGCAMGCAFCKTGTMGLIRNLTAGEIVEEFILLSSLGERISHIVFMGMGEALHNFTASIDAAMELHRESGFDISFRKMTISTCGLVPGINKLTELDIPIRLAVSLVSADDDIRSDIMKVNRSYPLKELKDALLRFQHHQDRRLTLEYCMLSGINTDRKSAEQLASFVKGLDALVNLIPWNPIPELGFRTPAEEEIHQFEKDLKSLGINYTIRRSKGRSISGACGQLATEARKN
ncbi:MAG: 23S rRNA (adenine(2503)-C(2))-methyltransferase RlmN [Spirochaetes bacterium]|uniref:23S rRNA (Adenine(2503)-C(2))-methyltransferase RlmN n=1 Tax=Candidatus Ornithospirochaeta stercoravium TaxID=2840897 RepID=A0A9D9IAF0_9SPIO|nr:23S rRNA (adenine(2503)-C(2))-methyltransferase RlmN [Candidatus Ornithospirochaeta stercoravium]